MMHENSVAVTGWNVVVNLRAGYSDVRFWRYTSAPSAAYGVAPNGMGEVDECATEEDVYSEIVIAGRSVLQ